MKRVSIVAIVSVCLMSCGKHTASSSTGAYSSDKPSDIIGAVSGAVAVVGGGMSASGSSIVKSGDRPLFSASNCDAHGDPMSGSSQMSISDTKFPGTLTYCKLTTNDYSPETVQGAYATPQGISCAVQKAGIAFDGAPHTVAVTFDTTCFSSTQLSQMGVSGSMSFTVTGSKPAKFNSYFDTGLVIDASSAGAGTYTLGTKVTSDTIEFVSMETNSDSSSGAFAGSLNLTTGQLRYDGRMERLACSSQGRCGWDRHVRAFADLTITNGKPTALKDVQLGYSNIQGPPGQNGYQGYLVTASGDLTKGIKSRGWVANNGSVGSAPTAASQYNVVGDWGEVTNTYCYTSSTDSASTCGSGLALFSTNTDFLLSDTTHRSPSDFLSKYAGMTFTTLSVDVDVEP